ncbi:MULTISPECIES: TolC family protein [unclassified Imperialibacter]|uniref:TolC family protein n=1 Tax=unclassified Imperialibacter TaxID=2629706 RepID=UPI00125C9F32|nr:MULTISPECIES: TolC family protein [unclassified Imperialibacter]CAD5256720.1 Outer membrane protein TolC [Imperialibacter sp. 75]CAD5259582.1 Outer membrane protein TolC [Imperialibacter sp. 89]VVT26257.1 Outer membrane protein TolC [Imperialibacter sp. EC-SDR9]
MKKILLTFGMALVILNSYAQTEETKITELSLSEAIATGLDNNFSIKIEKQNIDIATRNNSWGQAGLYPSLTFNLSQGFSRTEINNPTSFVQGAIQSRNLQPSLSLNWTLFNGFNVQITKERLEFLQQQSVGNATIVIENSIQGIVEAYYTVRLQEEQLSIFERSLQLSKDKYNYSKLKGELGSAVTFDILQDKSAYLTDSSNYITQLYNVQNALRNLNLLLGIDVETSYDLTDSLTVQIQPFTLDELYARMVANNSNLKNQYINQEIFKRDIGIARSAMYPSISMTLGGSDNNQVQNLTKATFLNGNVGEAGIKSGNTNYNANFTLSFTIFNGGRIRRQIENARVNEQIAAIRVDELKQSLKNNLINTLEFYRLRARLYQIAIENRQTAEFNLTLGEDRYRNGTISSFDFRDLQLNYLRSALSELQTKYNLVESEVELMRLTGGILEEYETE